MVFAAIFALLTGIAIIGQWIIAIKRKEVKGLDEGAELGRGSKEMAFHYVAEFGTAIMLIISAAGLFGKTLWGPYLFLISAGMLIYTAVNSAGYFAQKGQNSMLIMFGVILVCSLTSILLIF